MLNSVIKKLLTSTRKVISLSKDYVVFSGSILPAPDIRWCGPEFKDNSYYLQSTESEATRLVTQFGCNKNSRILDIGCGQGRLPIGILRVIGELDYTGIDVDAKSINWCKHHIESKHPSFKFYHYNIANARYNKRGVSLRESFRFGLPDNSIDIIYLFSVFSHMTEADMRIYLSEFRRVLDSEGKVFFTTFVEEKVPNYSINPDGYVFNRCSGNLHVVRYEKNYLFTIIRENGFIVEKFTHRTEADNQSTIYLGKKHS